MPVGGFLSEQACRYGRYASEPTHLQLKRFRPDRPDRELIDRRRGEHLRLWVAVQLGTVRFLGTFLAEDPLDVPWAVVDFLASQLGIADASCVKRDTERPKTAYEHAWEIAREFSCRGSPTRMLRLSCRRSWQRGRGLGPSTAQRAV